ncbi:MAG: cell division protein ZipA C-terminal FtsZ-binding domain-containing protein [Burkholderiales bacterium]|nr:cell division protein ZipA C-terminal FtsZ-binding domain-containing protein [Burkholderiales bacterium]
MSDLQIALAAIGLLVVGGVYAFNLWQERKLRQRLEHAFEGEHDDVLLKSAAPEPAASPRIEPRLGGTAAAEPVAAEPAPPAADGADPLIEFAVDIELNEPAGDAALRELLSQLATFGKPARLLGWDEAAGVWRMLGRGAHGDCRRLLATLQLVNRAGPLHAPQLNGFCDAVRAWAGRQGGAVQVDDTAAALQAARELDAFCGEMDVAIGLNVVAQSGAAFSGEQVAAAAQAAGFSLGADGTFHWRDAGGQTLFTMENHEQGAFSEERLAVMQTSGLTLLLDVPRVVDGVAALDRMAQAGTEIAEALGGFVVDDNRVPLQDAGVARIKTQLQGICAAMAERQIPAGSPRAQRLFA